MCCVVKKLKELRIKAAVEFYHLVKQSCKPVSNSAVLNKHHRELYNNYLQRSLSSSLSHNSGHTPAVGCVRSSHFDSRKDGDKPKTLPKLFYVQNPFIWASNKLDFRYLKRNWDPTFSEAEFQRGCRQAISTITHLISRDMYDNLKPLLTKQALLNLRREVELFWADEVKRNIPLNPEDVHLILPRKIHFRNLANKKLCDIDVVFIGLKWVEALAITQQILFIDIVARFHRNYSDNSMQDWTVSAFRVRKCNLLPDKSQQE